MQTTIGVVEHPRALRWGVAFLAAVTIGVDLGLTAKLGSERWALLGLSTVLLVIAARGNRDALGLRIRPVQGWRAWIRPTLWVAAAILVLIALVVVGMWAVGIALPIRVFTPEEIARFAPSFLVGAPLLEEGLYRLVFCAGVVAILRPTATIFVGGVLFGALHFVYGNPAPDNCVAGFFLVWAYLKSGSLVLPILYHAAGNGFVLVCHFVAWHWTH